jgi:TonB family protein
MICVLLTGGFLEGSTENTGVPIVIYRRIGSMSCELLQRGSLMTGKQFAWIEIEGVNGEVYSPELGTDDYLASLPSISGSVAKAARKSGFELKTSPTTIPDLPAVEGLNGDAKCPDLRGAIAETEQRRAAKREQLQSRTYTLGLEGITPPSYVSKSAPKPDQSATVNQTEKGTGAESKNKKFQGTVILAVVIGTEGTIRRVRIARSLSPKLDKKATEEVSRWTFDPARMKGLPVPSEMTIEISFNLH